MLYCSIIAAAIRLILAKHGIAFQPRGGDDYFLLLLGKWLIWFTEKLFFKIYIYNFNIS